MDPGSDQGGALPADTEGREDEERRRSAAQELFRQLKELPMLVLGALVIAVVVKTFLAQAFYIPSGSMTPTLAIGDRVLVEKVSYLVREPRPGHVVVFAQRNGLRLSPDVPWHEDVRNFVDRKSVV